MKVFLISLVVSGLSQWWTSNAQPQHDEHRKVHSEVIVAGDGEGTAHGLCCASARNGATDGPHAMAVAFAKPVKEEEGKKGSDKISIRINKSREAKDRGFLGISVGRVPEALASQLNIKGEGVIIRNVFKDSPAQRAGLQAHDVIISVGHDLIDGDVVRAVALITSHKPGDTVDLTVLRDGKEQEIKATLGSRADVGSFAFAFQADGEPGGEVEDQLRTRTLMLRRNADGDWVIEDLDDLPGLADLPDNLKKFLPKNGNRTFQIKTTDNGVTQIRIEVERDGKGITVTREGEGDITVTRVDEKGKETTATYADEDALRDGDEEAYDLFNEYKDAHTLDLDDDDDSLSDLDVESLGNRFKNFRFDFDFDGDGAKDHILKWKENLEQSLGAAREAQEKIVEQLQALTEKWKNDADSSDASKLEELSELLGSKSVTPMPLLRSLRSLHKPRHTFEVQPDGTIEVRIRKGDSELVQRFNNADDLAQRRPKLFKKYERLMDEEQPQNDQ